VGVIRRSVSATYRRGSKITVAALNQAVNGTHAFRGAGGLHHQLQSRSGGHLRPQLLQLDSGRAEPMVRPHQPPCSVGERRDMCCTASQVDTQRKSCSSTNPLHDQQRMRRLTRSIDQPRYLANGSPRSTWPQVPKQDPRQPMRDPRRPRLQLLEVGPSATSIHSQRDRRSGSPRT
jgi:hypothetical protein